MRGHRTRKLRVEHAGENDVTRIFGRTGRFEASVLPWDAFANVLELIVRRERGRLVRWNVTLDLGHAVLRTGDTGKNGFGTRSRLLLGARGGRRFAGGLVLLLDLARLAFGARLFLLLGLRVLRLRLDQGRHG
jgi:hypothetical protein